MNKDYELQWERIRQLYRRCTENIIEGVVMAVGCPPNSLEDVALNPVPESGPPRFFPIYESKSPPTDVVGVIEFGGLLRIWKKLREEGMNLGIVHECRFYGGPIDDLFPGKSEAERVALLKSAEPRMLEQAALLLVHYHDQTSFLERGIATPDQQGLRILVDGMYSYANPFSDEVFRECEDLNSCYQHGKGHDLKRANDLTIKILKEFSNRIREGFRYGRYRG